MDTPSMNTRSSNRKRSLSSEHQTQKEVLQIPIPKKRRRKSIKRKSLLDTVMLIKVNSANNSPCQSRKTPLLKNSASSNLSPEISELPESFEELKKNPAYYTFFKKHQRLSEEDSKWEDLLKKYEIKEEETRLDQKYPFAHEVEKDIQRNKTVAKKNKETLNYTAFSEKIIELRKSLKASLLSVTNTLQSVHARNKVKPLIPYDENSSDSEFNDCITANPKHLVINLTKIDALM